MLAFTLSFSSEVIFKVLAFISNKSFFANIVPLGSVIWTLSETLTKPPEFE